MNAYVLAPHCYDNGQHFGVYYIYHMQQRRSAVQYISSIDSIDTKLGVVILGVYCGYLSFMIAQYFALVVP